MQLLNSGLYIKKRQQLMKISTFLIAAAIFSSTVQAGKNFDPRFFMESIEKSLLEILPNDQKITDLKNLTDNQKKNLKILKKELLAHNPTLPTYELEEQNAVRAALLVVTVVLNGL